MTFKGALIKYLHQWLLCPTKKTQIKAVNINQLTSWPGLTVAAIEKYLPEHVLVTFKGHMRQQRKVIRTTKEKQKELRRKEI